VYGWLVLPTVYLGTMSTRAQSSTMLQSEEESLVVDSIVFELLLPLLFELLSDSLRLNDVD